MGLQIILVRSHFPTAAATVSLIHGPSLPTSKCCSPHRTPASKTRLAALPHSSPLAIERTILGVVEAAPPDKSDAYNKRNVALELDSDPAPVVLVTTHRIAPFHARSRSCGRAH